MPHLEEKGCERFELTYSRQRNRPRKDLQNREREEKKRVIAVTSVSYKHPSTYTT